MREKQGRRDEILTKGLEKTNQGTSWEGWRRRKYRKKKKGGNRGGEKKKRKQNQTIMYE